MAESTTISLFAGAGMLDVAVDIATGGTCTLVRVEREIPAAGILAARAEDGSISDAAIWSDVRTFGGRAFNGRVDGIIGGFPCTDLSVAGRQAGLDGDASGLYFEYVRIIREVQPRWVFIENVPPVLAFPTGGTVLRELAALGFNAEWGTIRASDVGAPHRRDRAFILAYATGGAIRGEIRDVCEAHGGSRGPLLSRATIASNGMAYAPQRGLGELREPSGRGGLADGGDSAVGNAELPGRPQPVNAGFTTDAAEVGAGLDHRPERAGGVVADASYGQLPMSGRGPEERDGVGSAGADIGLFPPGPGDAAAWQRILAEFPDLAPAVESELRGLVNVAASRVDRLRAGGNGVVVLQGAYAFRVLAERAGLKF